MPKLSFRVSSDWQEVVRLRNQIQGLKSDLKGLDIIGKPESARQLEAQLSACLRQYEKLVVSLKTSEAQIKKLFAEISSAVDMSKPQEELRKFDSQLVDMCENLDNYFKSIKAQLQDVMSLIGESGSVMGGINTGMGDNSAQLEEMRRQNAELLDLVRKRQEELEREREMYRQLADAVRNNSVATSQLTQGAQVSVREVNAKIKDINKEIAKHETYVSEVEERYQKATESVDKLRTKLDNFREFYKDRDSFGGAADIKRTADELAKAERKAASLEGELEAAHDQQRRLNESLTEYERQLDGAGGKAERIRTQIMNAHEDMVRMIASGQAGTPMFNQIAQRAGDMRKEMALANAYMQYFADPNRHLTALKQGLQGAAGGASLLVGVIGLFNEKSEEMVAIQTRLQSLLGTIVGLETTYNTVKKTSNVMIAIGQVQSWAAAKATAAQAAATEAGTLATIKATAAQVAFNLVAKANPYILLFSAIMTVVGGVYLLTKSLGKETDEQKKAAEAARRHAEELRKQHEAWTQSVASSAAKQLTSYSQLQRKWNELGDNLKAKRRFIKDNQSAFNDLGFAVNSVTDAESLLVNNTDAVVNAITARAKAAAYQTVIEEEIAKRIRAENAAGTTANGAYSYRVQAGQKAKTGRGAGYESAQRGGYKYTAGDIDADGNWTAQGASNFNRAAERDRKQKKAKHDADIAQMKRNSDAYVKQLKDNAKKEYDAEKAAIEKTGVKPFTGGTHTTGGSSSAENAAERRQEILTRQQANERRAARDLELSTREAQIKAMEEGTRKVLDQIELDHDKEVEAIRRAYDDMRLKRVEEAKELWESDPANKKRNFYKSDAYKTANVNTEAETENMQARLQAAEAVRARAIQEQQRESIQSMRDYLKEYGNELQQEVAITETYQEQINKARAKGDEGKALILEKKMQEELANTKMTNLQRSSDYVRAFEDLSNASSETLKSLISKFEAAKESAAKNLEPHQLQTYTDTLQRMYDELDNRNPFDTVVKSLKELAAAQREVKDAQNILDDIKAGKVVINTETGNAYTETEATERLTKAKDKEGKVYTKLTKATTACAERLNSFAGTLNQIGEMVGGKFGTALGAFGNILGSIGDAWGNIKNINVNATGIEKFMGQASAVAGTVSAMVEMNRQLDALLPDQESLYEHYAAKQREINERRRKIIELEIEQLQERLNSESWLYENGLTQLKKNAELNAEYAKAYGDIAAAPQEVYKNASSGFSKWAPAIIGAIVGIVAGVLTFGAGAGAGAALGAAIGSAVGGTAIGAALGATTIALIGTAIFSGVGAALGNAVRAGIDGITYKEGQTAAIDNMRVQTRHKTFFRSEKTQDLQSWVKENWGQDLFEDVKGVSLIDPEVARKLLEDGPTLVGETRETLEQLLEYSEKIREFVEQVHEYVSQAFSPLVDNLTDALFDWLYNGKDIMDSFRDYSADTFKNIAKDALKAMMTKNIFEPFQEQLEDLTIMYSTGQIDETGYMAGVAAFAQQAQRSIETQLPVLQNAAEVIDVALKNVGIDISGKSSSSSQQSATANSIQNISYDQADSLIGIETAQLIALEQGNAKKGDILSNMAVTNLTLADIRNIEASQREIADDTRDILADSYLELRTANEHLGKIEKSVVDIGKSVDKMKDDIKDMK